MTKPADSPPSPNKELPAGEGARCRRKKPESTGALRPTPDSPCPKAQVAQYQRPTPKSNLEESGYPAGQNICHITVRRDGIRSYKVDGLFDITQRLNVPVPLPVDAPELGEVFRRCQSTANSLMHRPISASEEGLTIFCFVGLPPSPNSLL
jgi:hypothetical protein